MRIASIVVIEIYDGDVGRLLAVIRSRADTKTERYLFVGYVFQTDAHANSESISIVAFAAVASLRIPVRLQTCAKVTVDTKLAVIVERNIRPAR